MKGRLPGGVLARASEFRRTLYVAGIAVSAFFSFIPFGLNLLRGVLCGGRQKRRFHGLIADPGEVPVDDAPGLGRPLKIYLLAGEDSGDLHASNLVRALKARSAGVEIRGMGGPRMEEAGCPLDFDLVRMSVMGVIPVIRSIGTFFGLFRDFLRVLDEDRPDVLVPVDYPGFNVRAARAARKRGVRVAYYIGPQVWAWAPWRIRRIARSVDRMLVILPFEREIWNEGGVPASFVGHPLFEHLEREAPALRDAGEDSSARLIGLLPGSRRAEIRKILPMMLAAAGRVAAAHPGVTFRLPFRSARLRPEIDRCISDYGGRLDLELVEGRTHEVMSGLDLALVASGTASLELAFYRVPMVVLYRIGRVAAFFKRFMLMTPHVALVNIVGGGRVVPELVQAGDSSEEASDYLLTWLRDERERHARREALEAVRSRLKFDGVADRVAGWVLDAGRPVSR